MEIIKQTKRHHVSYGYIIDKGFARHRDDDLPSYITDPFELLRHTVIWYRHGKKHRDNGPAVIDHTQKSKQIELTYYHEYLGVHRSDGPSMSASPINEFFKWCSKDDQSLPRPVEIYSEFPLQWYVRDIEITKKVKEWMNDCNIPEYKDWNNQHRILFKLTFS